MISLIKNALTCQIDMQCCKSISWKQSWSFWLFLTMSHYLHIFWHAWGLNFTLHNDLHHLDLFLTCAECWSFFSWTKICLLGALAPWSPLRRGLCSWTLPHQQLAGPLASVSLRSPGLRDWPSRPRWRHPWQRPETKLSVDIWKEYYFNQIYKLSLLSKSSMNSWVVVVFEL